ncbi:MAG: riboflavin synthase [Egibacteraceae bacterium]
MFTGIVEEMGTVLGVEHHGDSARLAMECSLVVEQAAVGDSISVNGCCVTVTTVPSGGGFTADLMGETLDRTALGALRPGDRANLERSLRADGRLGGHLVQGHVDGVGEVLDVQPKRDWTVMTFSLPPSLARYVVEKGSIAIDGASLTVMAVDGASGRPTFTVGLIPHTLAVTVFGTRTVGDRVNLEVDIVAKYVERLLAGGAPSPYR